LPKCGVLGQGLELAQGLQIRKPALAERAIEKSAKCWIGERHETAGRDAVGLIAEALWPELIEILEHARLEQLRMQRGDTVDGVTADRGEMGHAHTLPALLPDQRQPRHPCLISRETGAHLVEETTVDLVDDLQVPGQHLAEHGQRPGLQRLGQERV
jgi:hypothetical protein